MNNKFKFLLTFLALLTLLSLFVFSASFEPIYEKHKKLIPIYDYISFEDCFTSYYDNKSMLTKQICDTFTKPILLKYDFVDVKSTKQLGFNIDNKIYVNHNGINFVDNKIIEWSVPIGDRNFKEFGSCTVTEKNRGVCHEKDI